MSTERELIWVTKEQAKQFNELDEAEQMSKIALEIIEKKKLDISSELECLNDDVIQFKAACLAYKAELKKAYDEQRDVIEGVIDVAFDTMPSIRNHAETLAKEIQPVKQQLESMKDTLDNIKSFSNSISFWGCEKLLDLITQINSMDDKSKDVFKFLMSNYKENEK